MVALIVTEKKTEGLAGNINTCKHKLIIAPRRFGEALGPIEKLIRSVKHYVRENQFCRKQYLKRVKKENYKKYLTTCGENILSSSSIKALDFAKGSIASAANSLLEKDDIKN